MNIYSKLKTMYKALAWATVESVDAKQFRAAGHHVDVIPNSTLVPKNIIAEDFTRIQNLNNMISNNGKLVLKKYSCIGSQCIIIPGNHVPTVGVPQYLSKLHINDVSNDIVVEEDCWIGAGCVILSKARFGRGCVVGAGSLITKPVPPYAVAVGSPLKIVGARFTKDQIIEHERILYAPEERYTRQEIDDLFDKYFKGLRTIGTSEMSDEDRERLQEYKRQIGMTDFSNLNE